MNMAKKLRELVDDGETIVAPGAYDVLSAKIIEKAGFNSVSMGGYAISAAALGKPDVGLLTETEMIWHACNIADAVNIPVIADADTGYGNAINVTRTVRDYARAGVACIFIEDEVTPPKCGSMLGKEIISTEEMIGKIKAALQVRQQKDFMIIARTDAIRYGVEGGLEDAIERGKAYAEAGADGIFPICRTTEELVTLAKELKGMGKPLATVCESFKPWKHLTVKELEQMGYQIIFYATSAVYVVANVLTNFMKDLETTGTLKGYLDKMQPVEWFNNLVDLPQIVSYENKYLAKPVRSAHG